MADPRRTPRVGAAPRPDLPGLLEHLTATSLDEDYAHASARRGGRSRGRPGALGLVALAVFGVLVATAALQTSRDAAQSASSRASLVEQVQSRRAGLDDRQRRVRTLERQVGTRRASNLTTTIQERTARARLTRLGVLTGTAATRGPGIQVTLDDAPGASSVKQQVQSQDLQRLVNGLWQVGAEAIAINSERLTSLSAIRDAGSAVTVNFRSLRRPYAVSAVGDPDTMGARLLDTAGGEAMVTLQSTYGLKFDVETKDSMLLPKAEPVTLRSAHQAGARQ